MKDDSHKKLLKTLHLYRLSRNKLRTPKLLRPRTFDLQVSLAPYDDIVLDVINSIETDLLSVFDEGQKGALVNTLGRSDGINLSAQTKKSASIRSWLVAGCQVIRWDSGFDFSKTDLERGAMAMYQNNARSMLFPIGVCHEPLGPSAFVGEIICNTDLRADLLDNKISTNRLRFIIAHELTHVFDTLRLIVPAFKNWKSSGEMFWKMVLDLKTPTYS